MTRASENVKKGRDTLKAILIERDREIDNAVLALVAREHILLLGPPGSAKSMLVRALVETFGLGGDHFEWACDESTTPDALFGPIDLKRYMDKGEFGHLTRGKLPEATTAFIDEGFKLNNVCRNKMLPIANERVFHNFTGPELCPLEWIALASNEYPDESQDAFFDRFLFKSWVEYIEDGDHFEEMLKGDDAPTFKKVVDFSDIMALRIEAQGIPFGDAEAAKMRAIRDSVKAGGFIVSDRTWKKAKKIVRSQAAVNGHTRIELSDWHILADVLWKKHDQRAALWTAIGIAADPLGMQARTIIDSAITSLRAIPRFEELTSGRMTKPAYEKELATGRSQIVAALDKIRDLNEEAKDDSLTEYVEKVEATYAEFRELLEKVTRFRPMRNL